MDFFASRKARGGAILVAAVLATLLIWSAATYLPVHGEEKIYDAVIRLHVLANSDSDEDQSNKLAVRDCVLAMTQELMGACEDRTQAEERLTDIIPMLTEAARATLRERGCEHEVSITLSREAYPTRNYEAFCFPSGEYLSLRVMIGAAKGQNFWCVLFPPLCMSAATKTEVEEELIAVGLTRDQYAIITESENQRYRLRFKFMEAFDAWFGARE